MPDAEAELTELVVDLGVRYIGVDGDQLVFETRDPSATREDLDRLAKTLADIVSSAHSEAMGQLRSRVRAVRVGRP